MSITADIEKAAAKLQGDIDAAEFNLNGKKKTLAILQKECDQAEKALLKAEMAQYNARKKVVQKYIDDVSGHIYGEGSDIQLRPFVPVQFQECGRFLP